jgi:hypothetical protein
MLLANITEKDVFDMPEYFDRYINLAKEDNLEFCFRKSITDLWNLDLNKLSKLKGLSYATGKWTVNDILQHLSDTERILSAGVLRFARGEENYVISFDEETMADGANANNKAVEKIIEELIYTRKSTHSLYSTFNESDLQKFGINWKHRISVVAMGYNIIGHQIHHLNIIRDKYYSLL